MKRITKLIFAIGIFSILFLISCHKKTTMVVVKFDNESYTIEAGTTISEPETPVRERFEFLGWYNDDTKFDFSTKITTNLELVSKWQRTKCLIKFNTNCDEELPDIEIDYGATLPTIKSLEKEGFEFIGWYNGDEKLTDANLIYDDLELEAKWQSKTFRVEYRDENGNIVEVKQVEYDNCLDEPTEPIKEGYDFLGWYIGNTKFDFSTPITSNKKLYMRWEMNRKTLNETLASLIPEVIDSDIKLPMQLNNSSAVLTWSSSNEEVFSNYGKVTRSTQDVEIEISVRVETESYVYNLSFKTKIAKIDLKPLNYGSIVSGYLYDSGSFKGLTDSATQQLDIINYSFAQISSGKLYISGSMDTEKILSYREKGVRIVLAIGGWASGGFSTAMRTESSRKVLIDSIMEALKKYQFDGIDIDWEYPTSGAAGIDYHPSDKTNLTLFCKSLKEAMLAYRKDLILSIAVTTSDSFYDYKALDEYIDIFNLMTYDYAMGNNAYHDSALYSSAYASSSMDRAVKFMSSRVDSKKIIPGAAFYCRRGFFASTNNQNLGASLSTSMASNPLAFAKLKELMLKDTTYVEMYDEVSCAAYIIRAGMFYSYDNERSIKDKCEYVKNNNLGGLMCWDLTQDYVDNEGTYVLLNSMYVNLKKDENSAE